MHNERGARADNLLDGCLVVDDHHVLLLLNFLRQEISAGGIEKNLLLGRILGGGLLIFDSWDGGHFGLASDYQLCRCVFHASFLLFLHFLLEGQGVGLLLYELRQSLHPVHFLFILFGSQGYKSVIHEVDASEGFVGIHSFVVAPVPPGLQGDVLHGDRVVVGEAVAVAAVRRLVQVVFAFALEYFSNVLEGLTRIVFLVLA